MLQITPAHAHILEPWSITEVVWLDGSWSTRTAGDTYGVYAGMTWDSLRRSNLRHDHTHGYRFTHDVRDISDNLNASDTYITELDCPYYDKDDDNFNQKWEEAELTVECTSLFPQFQVRYDSYIGLMRWHFTTTNGWRWDPDGGWIGESEQLSQPGPWFGDKWDTIPAGTQSSPAYSTDSYAAP